MIRRWLASALFLVTAAAPAWAQWTPVAEVPVTRVFSLSADADTIVAGTDTATYLSRDAGVTWKKSSKPLAGVAAITAVRFRNGRLFAGTFGQGVFVSDDLGTTWQGFNQGLVGGPFDAQLDLADFEVLGDSLYAATAGAGVYVRRLSTASTWSHFGEEFEPNQASNVNDLALAGTRLLAAAGSNGTVFFRDPGALDWTQSSLANGPLLPGLKAYSSAFTGTGWVVGSSPGIFRSDAGQEPWTFSSLGLPPINQASFATRAGRLFAAFDISPMIAVIEQSPNNGLNWQELERLDNVFVFQLAMIGDVLYAGRVDGLWRRPTATVSAPEAHAGLRFALVGTQPVTDEVRFRFELSEPGGAVIEVFDVAGHRAALASRQSWPAGPHEVSWSARTLSAGVYEARLTVGGRHESVRIVHL